LPLLLPLLALLVPLFAFAGLKAFFTVFTALLTVVVFFAAGFLAAVLVPADFLIPVALVFLPVAFLPAAEDFPAADDFLPPAADFLLTPVDFLLPAADFLGAEALPFVAPLVPLEVIFLLLAAEAFVFEAFVLPPFLLPDAFGEAFVVDFFAFDFVFDVAIISSLKF
jgi:hypothetical protein